MRRDPRHLRRRPMMRVTVATQICDACGFGRCDRGTQGVAESTSAGTRKTIDCRHVPRDDGVHEKQASWQGLTGYFVPMLGVALAGSSQVTLQFGSAF
jgi:hypothetical protein